MKILNIAISLLSVCLLAACTVSTLHQDKLPALAMVQPSIRASATASPAATDPLPFWREIAADKDASLYPAYSSYSQLSVSQVTLSMPKSWTVVSTSSLEPPITNENGDLVGNILSRSVDSGLAQLGFLPNHSDLLAWKKLDGFSSDVYELLYVQTQPAASGDDTATVHLAVCVIDKSGQQATCFDLIKAVVNGEKVQYLVSNQVITQIEKSSVIQK